MQIIEKQCHEGRSREVAGLPELLWRPCSNSQEERELGSDGRTGWSGAKRRRGNACTDDADRSRLAAAPSSPQHPPAQLGLRLPVQDMVARELSVEPITRGEWWRRAAPQPSRDRAIAR